MNTRIEITQLKTGWTCDSCGESIQRPEDGYVEWLIRTDGNGRIGRDLRLVHHSPASPRQPQRNCYLDEAAERCRDGSTIRSLPLRDFLGHDGLTHLLMMISEDELPRDQVLELTKRLHTPGYEGARRHFRRAIDEGVIEPNTPEGFYWENDINRVLQFIDRERR